MNKMNFLSQSFRKLSNYTQTDIYASLFRFARSRQSKKQANKQNKDKYTATEITQYK